MKKKVYFPSLNGLRFIAALIVIVSHIEQVKAIFKIDNYWDKNSFFFILGKLGVVLFFVLSGFLITYLLLCEEFYYETISVKNFYLRRMLRIWPLYFLIIFLALFILPQIELFNLPGYNEGNMNSDFYIKLLLYLFFFPNLVLTLIGIVPYASHTWSIGTEEQYYLIWPVALNYFKKYKMSFMIFIIFFYLIVSKIFSTSYANLLPYKRVIREFWYTFNIDCMAIGGVFAILLFQESKLLKFIKNQYLFYITILVVILLFLIGFTFKYFNYEIYSVLFGIIILNFASNEALFFSLENRILNYFGSISYGIYMYHPIVIVVALRLCNIFNIISNWIIYPTVLVLTIVIAAISFKYFETYFLKFKYKFSNIESGKD